MRNIAFQICVCTALILFGKPGYANDGKAISYRDPNSGVTINVKPDHRHVVAVDKSGRKLWDRDPFSDAHLQPYRTDNPVIDGIGPMSEPFIKCCAKGRDRHYVGISYDSTQFGMIDVYSGEFIFLGQN